MKGIFCLAMGTACLIASHVAMAPYGAEDVWVVCVICGWVLPWIASKMGGRSLAQGAIWCGLFGSGAVVSMCAAEPDLIWAAAGSAAFAAGQYLRETFDRARSSLRERHVDSLRADL